MVKDVHGAEEFEDFPNGVVLMAGAGVDVGGGGWESLWRDLGNMPGDDGQRVMSCFAESVAYPGDLVHFVDCIDLRMPF